MTKNNVLISGASIAGPALAYWLTTAGYDVTVVERAPSLRPGGQAVDLRGAGRTVIERMGLMDKARALSLEQEGIAWVDDDGRRAAEMSSDAFDGEGIISEVEILRGDLSELLYEASLPGAEYLFDDSITAIEQDDDGVLVTFEKASPRRFDLVVGADGLHSTVRRLAFGPHQDCVTPSGCYVGWFTAPASFDLGGWYQMYNAPGGRVASARPGRAPGELKAALSFRNDALVYDRSDVEAQRELLAERMAGAGWQTDALVRGMRQAGDFAFSEIAQVRMDGWSTGRVVLVGDAGYSPTPLTGLGTSLALVGAYVLAGELAAADGDHRRAFAAYDRVMRPYVEQAQELPPGGVDGFAPRTKLRIALGKLTMRMMTRWPVRPLLERQFAKAGAIDLPDYAVPTACSR